MRNLAEYAHVNFIGAFPHCLSMCENVEELAGGGYSVSALYACGHITSDYFTEGERMHMVEVAETADETDSHYFDELETLLVFEIHPDGAIRLSVNYRDQPYYRPKFAETIAELRYAGQPYNEITEWLRNIMTTRGV
jgi:hypothetical protein